MAVCWCPFLLCHCAGGRCAGGNFSHSGLFFDNMLNLWTLCCTTLSELVGSPVVKDLNCNSKDPWFKPWCCEVFDVSSFGDA